MIPSAFPPLWEHTSACYEQAKVPSVPMPPRGWAPVVGTPDRYMYTRSETASCVGCKYGIWEHYIDIPVVYGLKCVPTPMGTGGNTLGAGTAKERL